MARHAVRVIIELNPGDCAAERAAGAGHFRLREMCVRPARHRQGLGTALLEAPAECLPGVRQ